LEARSRAAGPIPQAFPEAEGEGVEPSRLIARPSSSRVPSPVGLPFLSSTGGRSRTSNRRLNRAPPYRSATPVFEIHLLPSVGMAGFEPAISCSRSRRISQAFPHPDQVPSGSRTRTSAMARRQAAATSWARSRRIRSARETESTGWDSNPRRRITGAVSSPLDDQCNH
jgi:hypothetical protein